MSEAAVLAQFKSLAEQAAAVAIAEFHPQISQLERSVARLQGAVPEAHDDMKSPVLRWLAGLAAALLGGVIMAALFWVGTSITGMQQTLARIDERQKASSTQLDSRFADYDRRITRLEQDRAGAEKRVQP